MRTALERLVRNRAAGCCEYCRLPQEFSGVPFEIDHILARKHGGATLASNLALACFYCNAYKGPNIAGIDPATGKLTRLYHPRRHRWTFHFHPAEDGILHGRTAIGRTTIRVLEINLPNLVALRQVLRQLGESPPAESFPP